MYGTTETVTTYDKIETLYWAEKKAVEEGFKDWNVKYIGHFSHWFHWGVMLYSRFIIEEPPEDAEEALQAAQPGLEHGHAGRDRQRRHDQRAPRRRLEAVPLHAPAVWYRLAALLKSRRPSIPTAS